MSYDTFKDLKARLNRSIIEDKYSLTKLQSDNVIRDRVLEELATTTKNLTNLKTLKQLITNSRKVMINKNNIFKKDRIKVLEVEINNHLKYIFPEENFEVKLDVKPYRNSEHATLLLGKNGQLLPTKGQNGRLARQLIAVTCLYVINKLTGSKTIFMDEPLSCGDLETVGLLKPIIDKIIDDGIQIILVDNTHKLYENLTRRTFNLEKDRIEGSLKLLEVKDYECDKLDIADE